jgi:hypothetical protein
MTEKQRDFRQVHRPKQKMTLSGEPILIAEIDKRKTYYTTIRFWICAGSGKLPVQRHCSFLPAFPAEHAAYPFPRKS